MAVKRLTEEPPRLRAINPHVSATTEHLVDKLLRKIPRQRYDDYDHLLAALHELPASLERARDQDLSERSYFGWPTAADVAALYGRGRKLASFRDYRRLLELLGGLRSTPTRESASAYSLRS